MSSTKPATRAAPRRAQPKQAGAATSWGVLGALAAASVGIWMPGVSHLARLGLGWGLVVGLIAWIWKFGHGALQLLAGVLLTMSVLFGGPLHLASQMGYEGTVRVLVAQGFDVNARGLAGGATPLHMAAITGRLSIAAVLLEHGGDADAVMRSGETPMHEAAFQGHAEIVALLIEKQASLDAVDGFGQTALHRAAFRGWLLVVHLLVEAGCRKDIKDSDGILAADLSPYDQIRTMLGATPIQPHSGGVGGGNKGKGGGFLEGAGTGTVNKAGKQKGKGGKDKT